MALDVSYFWLPGLAWLFKELKTEDGVILQQRNSKLALEKKCVQACCLLLSRRYGMTLGGETCLLLACFCSFSEIAPASQLVQYPQT